MQVRIIFTHVNAYRNYEVVRKWVDCRRLHLSAIKLEALFWYLLHQMTKKPPWFLSKTWTYVWLRKVCYRDERGNIINISKRRKAREIQVLPVPERIQNTITLTYLADYKTLRDLKRKKVNKC